MAFVINSFNTDYADLTYDYTDYLKNLFNPLRSPSRDVLWPEIPEALGPSLNVSGSPIPAGLGPFL
jgi:hypothetical protein